MNKLKEEYMNFYTIRSKRACTTISSLKRLGAMELIFSVIISYTFLTKQIYDSYKSSIIFWYMTYLNAAIPTLTIE